jgi:hypothetical protein
MIREPSSWNYLIDQPVDHDEPAPDEDEELDAGLPMLEPEEELPELDLTPCPRCGRAPTMTAGYAITIACDNCYDGAPDSCTADELAAALTESEASAIWNARCEEFDS